MTALGVVLALATLAAQDQPPVKFGTTVVISSGLQGRVYYIRHNSRRLPDFQKLKSVGSIWTTSLNIPAQDFKDGFPGVTDRFEWFAIDYTGKIWIEHPGSYGFAVLADDGAKLYVDDRLVVNNDGTHPAQEKTGSADVTAGVHQIRISYFQGPRFEVALVVKVTPPGEQERIFDTDEFKPPSDPDRWPTPIPAPPR